MNEKPEKKNRKRRRELKSDRIKINNGIKFDLHAYAVYSIMFVMHESIPQETQVWPIWN